MKPMNRAVIFDLDGTLLDSLQDLAAAGNIVLKQLGCEPLATQMYRNMAGSGIPVLVKRMLNKAGAAPQMYDTALAAFREYYEKHSADLTEPYNGIGKVLDTLRTNGVRVGVLSNKDEQLAKNLCTRFFVNQMDLVCGLREGAEPKPDPRQLLDMIARLGSVPQHTIYVGDSDVDVMTAKRAGVRCVGVLWGFRSRQELEDAGADMLCDLPEALVTLLQF